MAEQLALFPPAQPAPERRRAVLAATVDETLVALGRSLPGDVRLGTSSWAFPGWAGIVYARSETEALLSREGLAAYAHHPVLRTVGIDRTFYAPVAADVLAAYAAQVPEGFRFLLKAPAAVTASTLRGARGGPSGANLRYLDAVFAVETFVAPAIAGLGEKLGPLVFQFPPQGREVTRDPERFVDRLHAFLRALREALRARGLQLPMLAVELRDAELVRPTLAAALADTRVRYCFGVHGRMPSIPAQAAVMALPCGPFVARWNLHAGYGYEEAKARYAPFDRLVEEDPDTREALARLVAAASAAGEPAYVTANNKAEGCAPLTIVRLAEAISTRLGALDCSETRAPEASSRSPHRRAASR